MEFESGRIYIESIEIHEGSMLEVCRETRFLIRPKISHRTLSSTDVFLHVKTQMVDHEDRGGEICITKVSEDRFVVYRH